MIYVCRHDFMHKYITKSIRMISEFIRMKSRSHQEKAFFPYIPHGFPLEGRHSVGSFVSEEALKEVSL